LIAISNLAQEVRQRRWLGVLGCWCEIRAKGLFFSSSFLKETLGKLLSLFIFCQTPSKLEEQGRQALKPNINDALATRKLSG
jgi:hypothetical protein